MKYIRLLSLLSTLIFAGCASNPMQISSSKMIFANVSYFMERLQGFIDQQRHPVRVVIIDARAIPSVDFTALEKLRPFFQKLKDQGIELAMARAHLPLREIRMNAGMEPIISEDNIFVRVSDAVRAVNKQQENKDM